MSEVGTCGGGNGGIAGGLEGRRRMFGDRGRGVDLSGFGFGCTANARERSGYGWKIHQSARRFRSATRNKGHSRV